MGVYLLIVVGATTSLTEAAATCAGWPACGGDGTALPVETAGWVALGHRLLAVVVGSSFPSPPLSRGTTVRAVGSGLRLPSP